MITNRIKSAKNKLDQHRSLGNKSTLSVYEVARLLDTIKAGEKMNESSADSIFFSLN